MRITFVTRKFGNVERNSHCDVLHITPVRVARLFLDCNGVFAIKAYIIVSRFICLYRRPTFRRHTQNSSKLVLPMATDKGIPVCKPDDVSKIRMSAITRVTTALTTRRWRHGRNANVVIHCVITVAVKRRRDQLWSRTRGK